MSINVFVVRAEFGKYTEHFREQGFVGIGWLPDADFVQEIGKDDLFGLMKATYSDASDRGNAQNTGQIIRFLQEMSIGDIVITSYRNGELLVGEVTSETYIDTNSFCPYTRRKKVKWFDKILDRSELSIPLQNTLRSSLTVFRIKAPQEILLGYKLIDATEESDNLGFSPDLLYDSIKNKFLQLDATEFELLVSYVLRSLGFEPSQEIGKVGDGGIDFEGQLNVMGIASINLQIQVKRYSNTSIGEKEIRNLRGALKRDYQGAFITLTKFSKKAKASASDPDKVPIQLINGRKFTEIFIEQYDKLMDAIYEDDNDDMASKLKFKKALIPE